MGAGALGARQGGVRGSERCVVTLVAAARL